MHRSSLLALALLAALATSGCASTTVIRSSPMGAAVRGRSGELLGRTPYEHTDASMNGTTVSFTVEAEGYAPEYVTIRRDQSNGGRVAGSILAGILMPPLGFLPLLWSSDYREGYHVELRELPAPPVVEAPAPAPAAPAVRRAPRRVPAVRASPAATVRPAPPSSLVPTASRCDVACR
jgi:hypothetical protein